MIKCDKKDGRNMLKTFAISAILSYNGLIKKSIKCFARKARNKICVSRFLSKDSGISPKCSCFILENIHRLEYVESIVILQRTFYNILN